MFSIHVHTITFFEAKALIYCIECSPCYVSLTVQFSASSKGKAIWEENVYTFMDIQYKRLEPVEISIPLC